MRYHLISKKGFSLMELLVVTSIIAGLSVVAYVGYSGVQAKQYNTRRIADVKAIRNGVDTYLVENKMLPNPTANRSYYDKNGAYMHSETSTGVFGVSSFFSNDMLPKYTLAEEPKDPKNNHFYAYGRNFELKATYDIGASMEGEGSPTAYIDGSSNGEIFPSFVKSYNGAGFVKDKDTELLPYNPYENMVTMHMVTSSGGVAFSRDSKPLPMGSTLLEGDVIRVDTGSLALFKVSDGSELTLGDTTQITTLELTNLRVDDTGIVSKVRLALRSGEIWTKAPKLRSVGDEQSSFEVETSNAVAAVRGTIFGARSNNTTSSTIIVFAGDVGVRKISVAEPHVGGTTISVPEFSTPKKLSIFGANPSNIPTTTQNLYQSEIDAIKTKLDATDITSFSRLPDINYISREGTSLTAHFSKNVPLGSYFIVRGYNSVSEILTPNTIIWNAKIVDPLTANINISSLYTILGISLCNSRSGNVDFSLCSPEARYGLTSDQKICGNALRDRFWNDDIGCQDRSLVAYAPYDTSLALYTPNTDTFLNPETSLSISSALGTIPDSLDNPSSGVTIPSGTGNKLKYDISSLKLGDHFAIEMRVRGADLKRSSTNGLYNFGRFYLNTVDGKLKLGYQCDGLFCDVRKIEAGSLQKLSDDTFYTIFSEYNGADWNLKILDTLDSQQDNSPGVLTEDLSSIYIGSILFSGVSQYQWGSIIDSIKFYKFK